MKQSSNQTTKLFLKDEKQFILITKTKWGYKITYHDQTKDNMFNIAELIGGKIIV